MLRLLDELTDFEKLSLTELSYSRLNTYGMCEAMYSFNYILKEPQQFGAPAALGNVVHGALERADFDDLKAEDLLKLFEEERPLHDPDEAIDEGLLEVGRNLLIEYADRHAGDHPNVQGRELYFEVVVGGGLFRGYIDRVDFDDDGGVSLVDYKTGKHQVAKKWIHKDLQLGLYALVARKLWPDRWPIRGQLYYLRTKPIDHVYIQEDLDWVEAEIIRITHEIIEKNNFAYTDNKRICSFCDHAKSGACPRGKWFAKRY